MLEFGRRTKLNSANPLNESHKRRTHSNRSSSGFWGSCAVHCNHAGDHPRDHTRSRRHCISCICCTCCTCCTSCIAKRCRCSWFPTHPDRATRSPDLLQLFGRAQFPSILIPLVVRHCFGEIRTYFHRLWLDPVAQANFNPISISNSSAARGNSEGDDGADHDDDTRQPRLAGQDLPAGGQPRHLRLRGAVCAAAAESSFPRLHTQHHNREGLDHQPP